MKWMRASNACQMKRSRILVEDDFGRRAREAKYAAARMATVETEFYDLVRRGITLGGDVQV